MPNRNATASTSPLRKRVPRKVAPPIEPMLAKLATELPAGGDFLFEPKWDGFRAIVFRHADDVISRAAINAR
jgi:ATP-dependent DNA ligase